MDFLKTFRIPIIIILLTISGSYLVFLVPFGFIEPGGVEKKDWLIFWGTVLSFIGTMFISMVALYQNKKTSEINNEMLKLSQQHMVPQVNVKSLNISHEEYDIPAKLSSGVLTIRKQSNVNDAVVEINQIQIDATKANLGDIYFKKTIRLVVENISNAKLSKITLKSITVRVSDFTTDERGILHEAQEIKKVQLNYSFYKILLSGDSLVFEFEIFYNDEQLFNFYRDSFLSTIHILLETPNGYKKEQEIIIMGRNNFINFQISQYLD